MPIRNYPFQILLPKIVRPAPLVPIRVVNPDNGFDYLTYGLIDTGADSSSIPDFVAKSIGHNLKNVKPERGYTADGYADIYPHTCRIEILKVNRKGIVDENKAVHVISDRLVGVLPQLPFVILGVEDFLQEYILTINYPRKIFSVRKP